MIDLCQWRASIGLFNCRYSGCSSLKRCGAASNRLWPLLVGLAMAFLSQLWSTLKRRVRRTNIATPTTSGTVYTVEQLLQLVMNFFFLLLQIYITGIQLLCCVFLSVDRWSAYQKGARFVGVRNGQSPVAVDGNRTMLLTGLVLGQEASCLFGSSTIATSVVRGRRNEPWPYHRWALYVRVLCGCYYRLVR